MNRGFQEVEREFQKHKAIRTFMPTRSTTKAAAYDFKSKESFKLLPKQSHSFYTDVKAYMLDDEVLEIYTRSGNGAGKGIKLRNQTGIIDADYYGNIKNDGNIIICLENTGVDPFEVNIGDKIAQGKFAKFLTIDNDMPEEQTRKGGLGSTGS